MASAPHIVWLFSDQHRADVLGAAGHPVVRTPHLDRLPSHGLCGPGKPTHGLLNKMVFYEPSVRVPLIIRPPGGGAARRFGGLVEHVDLTSTLLELAGAKPLPDAPVRSLASVLTGSPAAGRDLVVSENFGFGMWRTDRYKLVAHERRRAAVQLFDLAVDPGEDNDLVGDADYAGLVDELMRIHVLPFLGGDRR